MTASLETWALGFSRLPQLSPVQRYLGAVAAVAITTAFQEAVLQRPSIAPFVLFFLGVAVVASLAGPIPGLVTVLLSAIAANHFFIEPFGSWPKTAEAVPATALFLASATSVALLCGFLRHVWMVLSQLQRDLNRAQQVAQVGSWRLDVRSDTLVWSEEAHRIFGLPKGQPLNYERFLGAVHPEDRSRVHGAWQAALEGAPYDVEHRILVGGTTVKWARERAELEFDRQGHLCGGFGTVQDVSEQKKAQDAVRLSEERFRTMFETAGAAIAELNLETGALDKVNERFTELAGHTRSALEGADYLTLVPADERQSVREALERARAGEFEGGYFAQRRYLRRDSSTFEAEVYGTAVRDKSGQPVGAMLIVIDVTERNTVARELAAAKLAAEEASLAKDRFLAVLSHELRTPLSPVLTGISLVERETLSERGRHYLEVIRRNAELEARLIDDLLDLTRIAQGRVELRRQRVELCTIIDHAVEVCRPDIVARRLHFDVDFGPRPYVLEADAARLQQVFWNLLKNAVKFTPHDGCVGIRCRPENGEVVVEVNDSGIGIERTALASIFDAFTREERTANHRFGGLGLGLAIGRSLVEMHGGRIEAASDGPGTGASFRVYLPILSFSRASSEPRVRVEPPIPAPKQAWRVLLVEDHGDTAEMMVTLLELIGYEVATVGDVATALETLARDRCDILISDLGLPDRSGIELIRELRAGGNLVPAIALTGYGLQSDLEQSRDAGFGAHLVKPVDPHRLCETIELLLARAGTADAPR